MTAPRWAVVVVNYGSSALLADTFAFTAALPPDAVVVAVDNHTEDRELDRLSRTADTRGWIVVASPRNVGFGAGANLGARRAFDLGCEAVVLLNPDARADAPTVTALAVAALEAPRTVVAPQVRDSGGRVVFHGSEVGLATGRIRGLGPVAETVDGPRPGPSRLAEPRAPWLTGACLAIHRDLFTELGGFDPEYFMYWEDVDLSVRAARAGAALVLRLDLEVQHDEGGTQPRRRHGRSDLYYYWNARNRLRFAAVNVPAGKRWSWVRATPAVTREIFLRGGRRQLLTAPLAVTHLVRGAVAGLVLLARARRTAEVGGGR